MEPSNVAILNERLAQRPEPLREDLAGYILEHLDEIENDLNDAEESELTDAVKAELDRRLESYKNDPSTGISWDELNEKLASSR